MTINVIPVGMLLTNCYIVMDDETKAAVVIDPGSKEEKIIAAIKEMGADVKYIIFTHGHYDHIMAAVPVQRETGAKILINEADLGFLSVDAVLSRGRLSNAGYEEAKADGFLKEGDRLAVGSLSFDVMSTPGHSKGSICLVCGDAIFSGDTLFKGECGRWDLPGGSEVEMMSSLKRLGQLNGDYRVFPGHEGASTLEKERSSNRYMSVALRQL